MKKLSEIKLKTCPFCGGEAKFRTTNSFTPSIWVYCSKCNAKSNAFDNSLYYCAAEKAAENWNSRLEGNNVIPIDAEPVISCKEIVKHETD